MSPLTLLLYVIALGLWIWATHREGGIGIGIRFLYAFSLVHQFLVGPPLYFLSGLADTDPQYRNREPALQLVLASMAAFVIGGYVLTPLLLHRRLQMDRAWLPFAHRGRLVRQWQAAKALVVIGTAAVLLTPIMFRYNTVRAVWSNLTLLVEVGLVMMCMNAVLSRDYRRLKLVFGILVVTGMFRAVASGFFGGTAMTGLFLCSLIFMARGINFRAWVYLALAVYLMLIPYGIWMNGRKGLRQAIEKNAPMTDRVMAFELSEEAPLLINLFDPHDVQLIQHRIDQSSLLAAAIVHTPAVEPYAWGGTFVDNVLIALVPRILWPSKPMTSGGSEFVTKYTGIRFSQKVSVGVNYLLEFYANFGPIGTVLGLLCLGVACGILEYEFFAKAPGSLAFEWTTIMCMWTISVNDTLSQLAMSLPVALFVGWSLARFFQATGLAPVYFRAGYVGGPVSPVPSKRTQTQPDWP